MRKNKQLVRNSKKVDYLIIGQGIAGTILAFQLIKRGKKVLIVDKKNPNSSSRVAAGLFNPITGRKFVKTWRVDDLFPYLHPFYSQLEQQLSSIFFHKTDIYRPFESIGDQNDWMAKGHYDEFKNYVEVNYESARFPLIHNAAGGLIVKQGGFVDINTMLDAARTYFIKNDMLLDTTFNQEDVEVFNNEVTYQQFTASRMILCTGSKIADDWFSWLPFRPVKGEVLFLESKEQVDRIYNKGCFITPPINGLSRAGSTYEWKDLSTTPTEKARNTIMDKLNALIKWDVQIKDQKAGIRPATLDRKPFIGIHPKFETIFIFNGLGTKGVSLAPYFSEQFVGYLEDGLKLDIEVDIKRYYSLYYNSNTSKI